MKDFILIYDISNEKRLQNIAKYLEKRALRIQFSIYYLPKCRQNKLNNILYTLQKKINAEEDDLRVYEVDIAQSLYLNQRDNLMYLMP